MRLHFPASTSIHLVGRPGAGKSTLAARLSADLNLPHLDIANQPGHLVDNYRAWDALVGAMAALGAAIIESAGTSSVGRRALRGLSLYTVVCTAPEPIRRSRLSDRPAATEPGYVDRLLEIPPPPSGDAIWDGTRDLGGPEYETLLSQVRRALEAPAERDRMVVI